MLDFFKQFRAVLTFSLMSLAARASSATAAVMGFAVVGGTLASVLALTMGISSLWNRTGARDIAIVMGRSAFAEINSQLAPDAIAQLAQAPGLDRNVVLPISPQLVATTTMLRGSHQAPINVLVRGFAHPLVPGRGVTLRSGRMPKAGVNEVAVGERLAESMSRLALGESIQIGNRSMAIVGIFAVGGGIRESEVWGNASNIGDALGTPGQINIATVHLARPEDFDRLHQFIVSTPGLDASAYRESEYFRRLAARFHDIILIPGLALVALMAVAAGLAAVNTMHSAIQSRLRELATLRAIGFQASSVITALIAESTVLACLGGSSGALLAALLFHKAPAITSNGLSAMAFTMQISPVMVVIAVAVAAAAGIVGGIWPAISAARVQIVDALRAV